MTLLRAFPVIIWLQSFTHSTVLNELTVYNATSHHIKSGIPLTATFGTVHPLTANVPYCCVTVRALRFNVPIKGLNSRVTGTCISTDTELEHGCQMMTPTGATVINNRRYRSMCNACLSGDTCTSIPLYRLPRNMVIYWPGHRPRHHCLIVTGGIHRKQELRFVNERQKQRIWLFLCKYSYILLCGECLSL